MAYTPDVASAHDRPLYVIYLLASVQIAGSMKLRRTKRSSAMQPASVVGDIDLSCVFCFNVIDKTQEHKAL